VWYDNLVIKVMLMEHDRPTNYEEEMVDLSPRNDYESYMIRDKIHVRLPSNDLERSS
jgi:hypothetical protein